MTTWRRYRACSGRTAPPGRNSICPTAPCCGRRTATTRWSAPMPMAGAWRPTPHCWTTTPRGTTTPCCDTPSGDVARLDALHPRIVHLLPARRQRAVEIDAARGVLDHVGREAELARIHRRP